MTNCFKCGHEIFFDDDCVSKSGKKIPLDEEYDTGDGMVPHNCPENDFNKPGMSLEKRINALEKRIFNLEIGK